MDTQAVPHYLSGWSGGRTAIGFFILRAALIVGYVGLELRYYALGYRLEIIAADGGDVPWLLTIVAVALALVLAVIGGSVFFYIWLWRSVYNLRKLGAPFMSFTPGWAVGWWFVPLINLWRPYEILRELFHYSSAHTRGAVPETGSYENAPPYLLHLWIAFLVIAKLPRLWMAFYGSDAFPPGSSEYAMCEWVRYLPLALDSLFFIYVIGAVDKLQNARSLAVGSKPA
ncbi:DUF4328 domain-containing protein [bacterium]|nr:DUF4328 domain-containing protein [bacterium]